MKKGTCSSMSYHIYDKVQAYRMVHIIWYLGIDKQVWSSFGGRSWDELLYSSVASDLCEWGSNIQECTEGEV